LALNRKIANSASVKGVSCNIRTQFCYVASARHAPGRPAMLSDNIEMHRLPGLDVGSRVRFKSFFDQSAKFGTRKFFVFVLQLVFDCRSCIFGEKLRGCGNCGLPFSESNSFVFSGKSQKLFGHL